MALVKDGTRVGEAVFLYSFYYVKKKKKKRASQKLYLA